MKLSESITRLDDPGPPPPTQQGIEVDDNHVYFYSDINSSSALTLIRRLRELDIALRQEKVVRGVTVPIWLHINSDGGTVFDSFNVADQIAQIETPVYSVIEGCCASGATLISLACQKRYILPNSFMLIHQLSGGMWGKHQDLKDQMIMADMLMEKIVRFYVDRTGMKEKRVRKLLKRESWFDAGQCVELGLVDEVMKSTTQL